MNSFLCKRKSRTGKRMHHKRRVKSRKWTPNDARIYGGGARDTQPSLPATPGRPNADHHHVDVGSTARKGSDECKEHGLAMPWAQSM